MGGGDDARFAAPTPSPSVHREFAIFDQLPEVPEQFELYSFDYDSVGSLK